MELSSDALRVNHEDAKESKTDAQVFEHLTCMDSKDSSFGQNDLSTFGPITIHEAGNALSSQNIPGSLTQTQPLSAEHFHIVEQNGKHVQYQLQSLGESNEQMMIVTSPSENGQVLQVIPATQTGMAEVIIPQGRPVDVNSPQDVSEEKSSDGNLPAIRMDALADNNSGYILHPQASLTFSKKTVTRILEEPFMAPLQPLSSNTPLWACRLRSCERIGDSYRGYCVSETELESVLTFHKQQTQSVWGTRQSPSPSKPATRLMWKSQYVPYDGIPFVNAGSRAVVMECQYGPRRKGFQLRKITEQESKSCQLYKATCPARKFVERELFKPDEVPERHNLSFFPTVNDIKNHIHEVQKSLRNGDMVYNSEIIPATLQWTTDSGNILRETVTVTFAEGNSPRESMATKVETNRTGRSLSPEPTNLLSSLSSSQPKIFAQLQGLHLQPRFTSPDGSLALISVNNHPSSSPSRLLDSVGNSVMNNSSLLLGQSHSLQTDTCLTQNKSTASAMGNLPGPDQNLVAMEQLVEVGAIEDTGNLEGSIHQILLGDVQTIPIQIIDNHSALIEDNPEDTISVSQVKQEPKEPTLSVEAKKILDCRKWNYQYFMTIKKS
ncbi:calcium-responsive transcription factor isoform X7 [Dasypus novemcinctus]|uniref:calcium-responsive transcription factor isoform X7 n=1 Tax=Dasypus novemcinctus TaxID=9361 RepID=UPI0039C9E10F